MRPTLMLAALIGAVPAAEERPKVILTLDSVSAERLSNGDVLFKCRLTVENHTGEELKVRSRFFSVPDGLALVVQDETGKELTKQPYIYHQSPMAEAKAYPLPVGKAAHEIGFPVGDLPKGVSKFKVRLVGTIPVGENLPALASRVKEVEAVPAAGQPPARPREPGGHFGDRLGGT